MKAKVKKGDVIISLPMEFLDQQTAISSVFADVPLDSVDIPVLIEANRTIGVNWYYMPAIAGEGRTLHISIPTELIEWEE